MWLYSVNKKLPLSPYVFAQPLSESENNVKKPRGDKPLNAESIYYSLLFKPWTNTRKAHYGRPGLEEGLFKLHRVA